MTTVCIIDTETTELGPHIHQPYQVCIWHEEDAQPLTYRPPHSLEFADGQALQECGERGYDIPEPDRTAEGDVHTTRAVHEALRAIGGAS